MTTPPEPALVRLLEIMARLRAPVGGCPWDQVQRFETIAPYTIEEAYEVADAIGRGPRMDALLDELGDLLFQVVYHARMAEEAGAFGFGDVAEAISQKMIRRHPHVFGDAAAGNPGWEALKQAERSSEDDNGVLAGVPAALPALTKATEADSAGCPSRVRLAGCRLGTPEAGRGGRGTTGGNPGRQARAPRR